jgi:phosphoenolpyruvate carboxylase
LPAELRALVRQSVALLGEVIRRELGAKAYRRIEAVREEMASLRGRPDEARYQALRSLQRRLAPLPASEQLGVVHSFSLMLELMNACENAYRAYRLRRQPLDRTAPRAADFMVIYVLTAHPTESRAPANIRVFELLLQALLDALERGFAPQRARIHHLLEVAWRVAVTRRRKPDVQDEAEHIYSILLREETLLALVSASAEICPVYIRSWVGGDKDGHPGVDEKVMRESLRRSRSRIVKFAEARLGEVRATLRLMGEQRKLAGLTGAVTRAGSALAALQRIETGDGRRAVAWRRALDELAKAYGAEIGELHPSLRTLARLNRMFPALVVPLELRDSSELLVRAVKDPRLAIARMLRELGRLARGGDARWYARGLIVSTTHEFAHVAAACRVVRRELGGLALPVIPLFEDRVALDRAPAIVEAMLADAAIRRAVKREWDGYLEIMLGYSDSAKEMGVLASRLAISDCLRELTRLFARHRVTPLFFHGSGGSVDRGGGSIQEQTASWPLSALRRYKATIQGEMVERTFASPEITTGGVRKIAARAGAALHDRRAPASPRVVRAFAAAASAEYRRQIGAREFLDVVEKATAYRYLNELKIGSRPSKRNTGQLAISSLRAIPWVLSWTQTRVLFPTWWGVGTAWGRLKPADRRALKRAYATDPLFRSYVKLLGFTLAKVELPVWRLYLENSSLPEARKRAVEAEFRREYARARELVRAMAESRDLLWFRPWLGMSIRLRAPMIHPLNVLQCLALERGGDRRLIRESVTGIASGMMTTGSQFGSRGAGDRCGFVTALGAPECGA